MPILGISRKARRTVGPMTQAKYDISLGFTSEGVDVCTNCNYVIKSGDLIAYVNSKICCTECVNEFATQNEMSNWLGE